MRHWLAPKSAAILVLSLGLCWSPQSVLRAGEVDDAVDRGLDYLLSELENDFFAPGQPAKTGQLALETYALVVAGAWIREPIIDKAFDALLDRGDFSHTYTLSCIAFAADAALTQLEADAYFINRNPGGGRAQDGEKYRVLLEKAVAALIRSQRQLKSGGGAWHYLEATDGEEYDNSNTQFAVLALGAGAKRGVQIPPEVWERILVHYVYTQQAEGDKVEARVELEKEPKEKKEVKLVKKESSNKKKKRKKKKRKRRSGTQATAEVNPIPKVGEKAPVSARGWSYNKESQLKGAWSWSMTNAGLSSLILASRFLNRQTSVELQRKANQSIRDGFGWLIKHWSPIGSWSYYGIYSLEKVGDLAKVKKFGDHDWYEEVSSWIIKAQAKDGSWPGDDTEWATRKNTAFALLALTRATSLLVSDRIDRTVLTGPGIRQEDDNRDDWVYIQSLSRDFHIPSLFRILRLRPNPKLAKFVNLVVKNYPVEKKGRLVPVLLEAYERLKDRRFKQLVFDRIVDVVGVKYKANERWDIKRYHVWAKRWKKVDEIGTATQTEKAGWLMKVYPKTIHSIPLRSAIIWALTRCQATQSSSLLIEDLDHEKPSIRDLAYTALTTMPFRGDPIPPFNTKGKSTVREEQIAAIKAWHEKVAKN